MATQKDMDTYRNLVLPVLGVLETIATAGASKGRTVGTSALQQQRRLDEQALQQQTERERAIDRAAQRELTGVQTQLGRKRLEQMGGEPTGMTFEEFGEMTPEQITSMAKYKTLQKSPGKLLEQPKAQDFSIEDFAELAEIAGMPEGEEKSRRAQTFMARKFPKQYIGKTAFPPSSQLKDVFEGLALLEREKALAEEIKGRGKIKSEGTKAKVNFSKTLNLFNNLWTKHKGMMKEGAPGGGLIKGGIRKVGSALQQPGFKRTQAFDGQMSETAAAMMRLITGSVRFVSGFYAHLRQSLPDWKNPPEIAAAKISQSVENAYGLARASRQAGLEADLQVSTDEELLNPNSEINQQYISLVPEPLNENDKKQIEQALIQVFGQEDYNRYIAAPKLGAEFEVVE